MEFLIHHGEKLITALIVTCCSYFLIQEFQTEEPQGIKDLDKYQKQIKQGLQSNPVRPEYPYSEQNRRDYNKALSANFQRPLTIGMQSTPSYAIYPQPVRAWVDPKEIEDLTAPEKITEDKVALATPAGLSAKADHHGVYVACRIENDKLKYFKPYQVEILRKGEKDKEFISVARLFPSGSVPEAATPATPLAPPPAAPDAAVDKPENRPNETTRERVLREVKGDAGAGTAPAPAENKNAVAMEEDDKSMPEEYKGMVVYHDRDVSSKKTYQYKIRLIGQLDTAGLGRLLGDGRIVIEGNDNDIRLTNMKEYEEAPIPAGETGRFFYSAVTNEVEVSMPPHFRIRFAGIFGELPDPAKPWEEPNADYQGRFELEIWVPKIRAWQKEFFQVKRNERLQGAIRFKDPETGKMGAHEFVTEFKLKQIRKEKVEEKTEKEDFKTDKDGAIVRDSFGNPIREKKVYTIEKEITVAIIEDLDTHKEERHPFNKDFAKRQEWFTYMDRLAKQVEAATKAKEALLKNKMKSQK